MSEQPVLFDVGVIALARAGTPVSDPALDEGVETIVTLDDDFERINGLSSDIVLSAAEFAALNSSHGY